MDDNVFNAKMTWQKAQLNTDKAINAIMQTAKAANDDRNDPAYIASRAVYAKAIEDEKQAKKVYRSAMAKQNFKRGK